MAVPIVRMLRAYMSGRRWVRRHPLPDWLEDVGALIKYADIAAYCLTFIYIICCPRHFYRRIGIISRPRKAESAFRYPYLQRPLAYLLAFLLLTSILARWHLGAVGATVRVLERTHVFAYSLSEDLPFVVLMLFSIALIPIFAVLCIVVVAGLAYGLKLIGLQQQQPNAIHFNWRLFKSLGRKRFWQGYHYSELVPVLLYYNVNAIILVPLTIYLFERVFAGLSWLAPFLGEGSAAGGFLIFVLALSGLLLFYPLIMGPLMYAILFRSEVPCLRQGFFTELLLFGALPERPHEAQPEKAGYLDQDLLPCSAESAVFLQGTRVSKEGRRGPRCVVPLHIPKSKKAAKAIASKAKIGS